VTPYLAALSALWGLVVGLVVLGHLYLGLL
jgi:hypothetical protein